MILVCFIQLKNLHYIYESIYEQAISKGASHTAQENFRRYYLQKFGQTVLYLISSKDLVFYIVKVTFLAFKQNILINIGFWNLYSSKTLLWLTLIKLAFQLTH